jgi:hypothetical protein
VRLCLRSLPVKLFTLTFYPSFKNYNIAQCKKEMENSIYFLNCSSSLKEKEEKEEKEAFATTAKKTADIIRQLSATKTEAGYARPCETVICGQKEILHVRNFKNLGIDLDIGEGERDAGMFYSQNKDVVVLAKGAVDNCLELCQKFGLTLKTGKSCEILLHIYMLLGVEMLGLLAEGGFSFIIRQKLLDSTVVYAGRGEQDTEYLFIRIMHDIGGIEVSSSKTQFIQTRKSMLVPNGLFFQITFPENGHNYPFRWRWMKTH